MPKFFQTKEFRDLNATWRETLKGSGFVDAEDEKGNLKTHDTRTLNWRNRERIETFFQALGAYLQTHNEIAEEEKKILEFYAEGMYREEIQTRMKRSRTFVTVIIRKHRKAILESLK